MRTSKSITIPIWVKTGFVLINLILLLSGLWFYKTQQESERQEVEEHLKAIVKLKADELSKWQAERMADAAVLIQRDDIIELVENLFINPSSQIVSDIKKRLKPIKEQYHYHDILIVDTEKQIRLSLSGNEAFHLDETLLQEASVSENKPLWTGLHIEPLYPFPHLSVIAPLFTQDEKHKYIGAIILISDANQFLYPLIQSWPTPSKTSETLLIQRDGDDVLFLNELRHRKDTALKLRIPVSRADLPAAMAVEGKKGIVEGKDYRNVEVIAAIRQVNNFPWFIIAKIDKAEAFAQLRFRSILILILILGTMAIVIITWLVLRQRRLKTFYQELYQSETDIRQEIEQSEKALKESQRQLVTLMSNLPGMAYQCKNDPHWTMKFVSQGCQKLTGYTAEDLIDNARISYAEIIHPDDHQIVWNNIQEAIKRRESFQLTYRILTADGNEKWVWEKGKAVFTSKDKADMLEGFITDITDRKQTEEALRQSEEKYRNLVENINDVLFTTNEKGIITYISPPIKIIIGFNPEQIIGKPFQEFLHQEDLSKIKQQFQKVMMGEIEASDYRLITKTGEIRWIRSSSRPILKEDKPVGLQGMLTDITEKKRAEIIQTIQYNITQATIQTADINKLFEVVRNELSHLVDTANFALVLYDKQHGKLNALFGKDKKSPIPESWDVNKSITGRVVLQKKSLLLTKKKIQNLAEKGEIKIIGTVPEIWLGIPLFAEQNVIGALVIQNYDNPKAYNKETVKIMEVTTTVLGSFINRKRAEAERERLSAAIEQAVESVVITDPQGTIEYVNPAFEKLTGYSREESIGQNPNILNSGKQDKQFYKNMWDTISSGNIWQGRIINRRKDGSLFTEEATISPVFDFKKKIVHYVAVKRDISKELELEQQYRQAQKMESIGRLAGGIAHDFNNMLGVILGYSEMSLAKLDPSDALYTTLQEIHKAGLRSADLTNQLLAFARKQTIAPKVLNLNDIVSNMLKMLRRLIGEDIKLNFKPGADLWSIKIDPAQIDQILANLTVNARDAIKGNGNITIETENISIDETYTQNHIYTKPGLYVLLIISDDGSGMDTETLTQIFEPFFTTKPTGEGTGLGLATVYGIVKQNEGSINVYSEPGEGTTFKIYFPRYLGSELVDQVKEIKETPKGRGESILLVEDETAILELAQIILESMNYKVLSTNSAMEAINIAQNHTKKIDLLITDVVMPEMNGKDLSNKIQEFFPEIRTIFMSGYTADAIVNRGVLDEGVNFIGKPFSIEALAVKVREVLDQ